MEKYLTTYLHPAAIFVSKRPHIVNTVLGSCVSVFLWDRVLKCGGVNHFMLPCWNGEGLASPKYGSIALEKLLEKMIGLGCEQRHLQAKVFGGSHQLEGNHFHIGRRNVLVAIDFLEQEKISILACQVGGERGRKLRFFTDTGEVYMKLL